MAEMILNANTLPEPLFRLIKAEKVKVRESDGEILLIPIVDTGKGCPLRGMLAGCDDMSVDKFLERRRADKELDL